MSMCGNPINLKSRPHDPARGRKRHISKLEESDAAGFLVTLSLVYQSPGIRVSVACFYLFIRNWSASGWAAPNRTLLPIKYVTKTPVAYDAKSAHLIFLRCLFSPPHFPSSPPCFPSFLPCFSLSHCVIIYIMYDFFFGWPSLCAIFFLHICTFNFPALPVFPAPFSIFLAPFSIFSAPFSIFPAPFSVAPLCYYIYYVWLFFSVTELVCNILFTHLRDSFGDHLYIFFMRNFFGGKDKKTIILEIIWVWNVWQP